MKLPNWFRITWWILITLGTAVVFFLRLPSIIDGNSISTDVFIFLVLVALLLVPIFQEVSLFGLKFNQAVDEMKQQISNQLAIFKAETHASIINSSNINVTLPSPPPDDQLPDLEERVTSAVSEALTDQGIIIPQAPLRGRLDVDGQTLFLFKVRNTIERKLRRIASELADLPWDRSPTINTMSRVLVQQELVHPKLMHAIREIYSVCSPAIHGEKVTEAQFVFVTDVSKQVIDALSELESRKIGST